MNSGKYSRDRMVIRPSRGGAEAVIRVNGREPQGGAIPGRLFGNFFEHLGFATQGGILAQALNNPTMTMDENMPDEVRAYMVRNGAILEQVALMGEERARRVFGELNLRRGGSGFSIAVMDDMRNMGIPFPWKAAPAVFAKGGQKGRVGNSVLLAPKDCEVVLSQGVFLAQHRVLTYEGLVWVRAVSQSADSGNAGDYDGGAVDCDGGAENHVGNFINYDGGAGNYNGDDVNNDGSSGNYNGNSGNYDANSGSCGRIGLEVRLARRSGEILARQDLGCPAAKWSKLTFSLTLPGGVLAKGEPVDFQIAASGRGELYVDRACLSPADHVRGFDPEFLELTKKYAPPVLRAPGGNFVSGYHFWHGIGDLDRRQTFKNTAWHGIETNFFGPDEFISLCDLIGSEPHIVINLGDGIPEEAAAWVEYMNGPASTVWGAKRAANGHPEPYNVRLWEVGNEIYGEWQTGNCGDAENARRYRETAKAMLAADPTIELIANGSEFDFYKEGLNWNRTLLEEGGETLGCVSLHALPGNQDFGATQSLDEVWLALQAQPARWERIDLPELIDASTELCPDRQITFAITEWGILGGAPFSPSVANSGDSVYGASFYNMCMRLKEYIKVTNATALYHGGCLVRAGVHCYADPQMEVIRRYTEFTGGTLYPVEYAGPLYSFKCGVRAVPPTRDIATLDAACVKTVDGRVVIAVVNRHYGEAYPVEIKLDGFGMANGGATDSPDKPGAAGKPAASDQAAATDKPDKTFKAYKPGALTLVSCEMQQGAGMNDVNTPLAADKVAFRPHGAAFDGNDTVKLDAPPRSVIFLTFK